MLLGPKDLPLAILNKALVNSSRIMGFSSFHAIPKMVLELSPSNAHLWIASCEGEPPLAA
jgi:hypothetical protein